MRTPNTPRTFLITAYLHVAAGITPLSEARDPAPAERRAPRRTVHTSPGGSSFTGPLDSDGRGPTRNKVASRHDTRAVRVGSRLWLFVCVLGRGVRHAGRVGVRPHPGAWLFSRTR